MSFVLDSSVALSWCFRDEQTPETLFTLKLAKTQAIFVPSLWHVEVANVLGLAARKGRLSRADLDLATNTLEFHTDHPLRPVGPAKLLPLMRTYELTAYDATYLELAMRLELPLATLDKQLIEVTKRAGVTLVSSST